MYLKVRMYLSIYIFKCIYISFIHVCIFTYIYIRIYIYIQQIRPTGVGFISLGSSTRQQTQVQCPPPSHYYLVHDVILSTVTLATLQGAWDLRRDFCHQMARTTIQVILFAIANDCCGTSLLTDLLHPDMSNPLCFFTRVVEVFYLKCSRPLGAWSHSVSLG